MSDDWSRNEVEAAVAAYLDMLNIELRGQTFNKTERRRQLRALLNNRTEGSIERKHQNISAVLIELGFPYVRGYKPLSNYQRLLYEVVADRLAKASTLDRALNARVTEPLVAPPVPTDFLACLVDRPMAPPSRQSSILEDAPRPQRRTNYLEREAHHRRLGLLGEQFVMKFESERLWRAGQKSLAERIEHVSDTRGDGEGFDVLSFEEGGRERLIEVKTTTFGEYTPFFVSRNEVEVSFERAEQYHVYRLFDFREDPKLFIVPGYIARSFTLDATQFEAR